ncbi:MAG: hypothetical protein A2V88_06045 [Elusimicrobia bacterium RBG_16_66_12]|nr:MAG: hypothetical protein A2V88_06045 [Elusimicrobia bacterium RBG_16_66_12]
MKTLLRPKSSETLRRQIREAARLALIVEAISSSLRFEEILDRVYKSFRGLLPYDRIGLALVADAGRVVRSIGARSNARKLHIAPGYFSLLKGSSLAKILKTGKPRIISDLTAYLREHPRSDSTRRIVAEGMRSSLTYPLIAQGRPVGFIFFSSRKRNVYAEEHIAVFRRVATLLSIAVEKGCLYKELEEADEMKNRLMGIAAHDLRNPLTVAIGYLALLQEDAASDAVRENVAIVQGKCRQMLSIVDSLLDSSLIQSRGLELSPDDIDLREFLGQICAGSRILAEPKDIKLKLELPPELPKLTADRSRLLEVFDNIIGNAIKYSPPKTAITLSARAVARAVEISVANEGQGIPAAELPLLFKEFGRTSVRPTAGERSIGLGLSIAQRIVKAHGGTIRVKSRSGVGTTFTVALPLRARRGGRVLFDLRR